jgi:hypothetical protein
MLSMAMISPVISSCVFRKRAVSSVAEGLSEQDYASTILG